MTIKSILTSIAAASHLTLLSVATAASTDIQPAIAEFNALHHAKAKPLFAALVNDAKHKDLANYYLGRIELGFGNYDKAREYLETSLGIEPNSADEYYWLSLACGGLLQQPSHAQEMNVLICYGQNLAAALDVNPKHLLTLQTSYQLALTSSAGTSPEDAEEFLKKIEATSKAEADAARLVVLNLKKETEKALALSRVVVTKHQGSERALLEAGKAFSNAGKFDEAMQALQLVTSRPVTIDNRQWLQAAYLEIGHISWRSKNNFDRAIAALIKSVDREIFATNAVTNWAYWRLSQLAGSKGDVTQQKKYLAALDATGIEKATALLTEMQATK